MLAKVVSLAFSLDLRVSISLSYLSCGQMTFVVWISSDSLVKDFSSISFVSRFWIRDFSVEIVNSAMD